MPFKKLPHTPVQAAQLARVKVIRDELAELSRTYEPQLREAVRAALAAGVTWTDLGKALGVSRTAATDKYLRLLPPIEQEDGNE